MNERDKKKTTIGDMALLKDLAKIADAAEKKPEEPDYSAKASQMPGFGPYAELNPPTICPYCREELRTRAAVGAHRCPKRSGPKPTVGDVAPISQRTRELRELVK
jgi:hypothetical protein